MSTSSQLPVFVEHDGRVEVVAERQNYLLYDRMVAFHIQRGVTVPLSAGHFYAGLNQRFLERDDMYFTELQAAEYDQTPARGPRRRAALGLRRRREERDPVDPRRTAGCSPRRSRTSSRSSSASSSRTASRNCLSCATSSSRTSSRIQPPIAGAFPILASRRTSRRSAIRALLNEFATYVTGTAKLKRFRLEAIRAGFADLWAKRDYRAIIKLAERLPDEVVQEDPALLMYYDNAVTREGAG